MGKWVNLGNVRQSGSMGSRGEVISAGIGDAIPPYALMKLL